MAVPDFVDAVRFVASAGGTADFVASGAAQGYRNAPGNLTDGATYRYRAESADLSQWEIGTGTWTAATSTFARTTVLFSSTGAKVSFTSAPQVAFTVQAQDLKTTQAQNDNSVNLATTQYVDRTRHLPDHARLVFVSATQIKLAPYNGYRLPIAGLVYDLPSGGVTAANTSVFVNGVAAQNLAASTLYYVYLFNNAGTLTLDFSTTAHATDTASFNIGVEIKSGDNSRTLVGMVATNASSQFADTSAFRGVASWFNKRKRTVSGNTNGSVSTSSTTMVELTTGARAQFLSWGDGVMFALGGFASNSTATVICRAQMSFDAALIGTLTSIISSNANDRVGIATTFSAEPSEALHTTSIYGDVASGSGSFTAGFDGTILI